MKRDTLSRSESNKLRNDPGQLAEELVAGNYENYTRFGVENFDVEADGKLGEVKSTATRLDSGAKGRFRLWKTQHEKLLRADRKGIARYVFVLFDVSERPVTARMLEKIPAEIGYTIGAHGGWNKSGHSMGPQSKLPISAVFDS